MIVQSLLRREKRYTNEFYKENEPKCIPISSYQAIIEVSMKITFFFFQVFFPLLFGVQALIVELGDIASEDRKTQCLRLSRSPRYRNDETGCSVCSGILSSFFLYLPYFLSSYFLSSSRCCTLDQGKRISFVICFSMEIRGSMRHLLLHHSRVRAGSLSYLIDFVSFIKCDFY